MAVSPINLIRVSHSMRSDFIVNSLRSTQRELFLAQSRIASGRAYISPSEDPVSASRAVDLTNALSQQRQFQANLQFGDNELTAADNAIGEISSLLIDAHSIASQNVSNLTSAAERAAEAELVAGIREQLLVVGNRQFNGRYIFGGRDTTTEPFVTVAGGIAYVGDVGDRYTRSGGGTSSVVNAPGHLLFRSLSDPIDTDVDLTPSLTADVRLEDIIGAAGVGIRAGTLVINEVGGVGPFNVDLTQADTIGDVVDAINAAAAAQQAGLTATLVDTGIQVSTGSSPVSISDTGTGGIAADLGIRVDEPVSGTITGLDLTARVTRLTPVEALARGTGIDLTSGFIVTNGDKTATIDLSDAQTVQDVVNTINGAGVNVYARINDAGTGLDVFNQISGTSLTIGENGGTTASDLGIRTFDTATRLDRLNNGTGVVRRDGMIDLRITTASGDTVDVNLDAAVTIGDVIDLINAAATDAGVAVTASFKDVGNGIQIVDGTSGTGQLTVSSPFASEAWIDLGLQNAQLSADGTTLIGADVNPTQVQGIITALIDLEKALRADDTQGISIAGERINDLAAEVTRIQGVIGARAQAMSSKRLQMEDASITTEVLLSDVRDIDYASAVTELQSSLSQMQASLQSSSMVLNLSLLDFLR